MAFGNTAVVMLSLAPNGMEDIPQSVRRELESFGAGLGFRDVLVVDSHNAMGKNIVDSDRNDLIASAKQCLEQLKRQPQEVFRVGFASLDDINHRLGRTDELGKGGLATLIIHVGEKNYAIGWADSNNMENMIRNYVISTVNGNITMLLEIPAIRKTLLKHTSSYVQRQQKRPPNLHLNLAVRNQL
jgi:predicted neutral ceramidase superfamily lipid hydrolase